jgi:hypothetical protein
MALLCGISVIAFVSSKWVRNGINDGDEAQMTPSLGHREQGLSVGGSPIGKEWETLSVLPSSTVHSGGRGGVRGGQAETDVIL